MDPQLIDCQTVFVGMPPSQRKLSMFSVRRAVYGLVLIVALHGCSWLTGTDVYVNKQYDANLKPGGRLAIVPITQLGPSLTCTGQCPPMEEVTDRSFQEFFTKFSDEVQMVSIARTRTFFQGNPDLRSQLIALNFSSQELANDPGLRKILRGQELASIREELGDANLLLVPARFELVPHLGSVVGYSEFRLYDLDSGSMIFSTSRNLTVNRGDEIGRGLMAIVLISHSKSDFAKLYLKRGGDGP